MTANQFNLLLDKHSLSLKHSALRFTNDLEDAQDLLQDTILRAMSFYEKFEEGSNIRGWLFVIMKSTFINGYRKDLKLRATISQEDTNLPSNLLAHSTKNTAEGDFAMEDIKRALIALPKTLSVPFIQYTEGYKYEEIAEEMGIPMGTVKTRIHHARALLKIKLKVYRNKIN